MNISVVIPAFNEERRIGECLEALKGGKELPLEIIIVDGGSQDRTKQIATRYGVSVLDNPDRHAAGGRNIGIRASKGDIVAFLDADCIPHENWLREIRHAFDDARIDGIGTFIEPVEPENRYEEFWGNFSLKMLMTYGKEPYIIEKKTLNDAFITASCAYRRDLLLRLGGFNSWFGNNAEDIDLCWRALDAGARLKYVPSACVKAHSPTDLRGIRSKSFRNGISSSKLQKMYGHFFNFDANIYKILFENIAGMFRNKPDADLFINETVWHLLGKYYGSLKIGIINI